MITEEQIDEVHSFLHILTKYKDDLLLSQVIDKKSGIKRIMLSVIIDEDNIMPLCFIINNMEDPFESVDFVEGQPEVKRGGVIFDEPVPVNKKKSFWAWLTSK